MPSYTFECNRCDVTFHRTLKLGNHPTSACPGCGDPAKRALDSFGFAFKAPTAQTKHSPRAPNNTGVHKDDYPDADRAVGKSSEARWEEIEARGRVKQKAREMGQTHALIRHTAERHLDYEPMTEAGLQGRKKLYQTAKENS